MNLRNILFAIGGVALLGALAVGGWLLYLDIEAGDGQASDDIENVVDQVDEDTIAAAGEGAVVFSIISDESAVNFYIDEELRGSDITVIGTTDQVGGQIVLNPDDPSISQVGDITINVRTLETDDPNRNNALRARILNSAEDEYEFAYFRNLEVSNMPDSVEIGVPFTFQITGDLTLVDTTRQETFDVTVTPISETRIEGIGSTTILYADYNISVPQPGFVGFIADEVILEIDFVAEATELDPADVLNDAAATDVPAEAATAEPAE